MLYDILFHRLDYLTCNIIFHSVLKLFNKTNHFYFKDIFIGEYFCTAHVIRVICALKSKNRKLSSTISKNIQNIYLYLMVKFFEILYLFLAFYAPPILIT